MLRRPVRQTQKSGVYLPATVEEVNLGYATVRLSTDGARLTNLPVMGGMVVPGEKVIVDYSGGTPPLVRPVTTPYEDSALDLDTVSTGEGLEAIQSDVSFKVYATTERLVGTSYAAVQWDTAEWQTENFFTTGNPTVITIPFDGYYLITANIAVQGFADHRSICAGQPWTEWNLVTVWKKATGGQRVKGELVGSVVGSFGFAIGDVMDMDVSQNTTMCVTGMAPLTAGETVTLFLKHTDPDRDTIDLKYTAGLYSRIWGFRLTHGGWADAGGYAFGTTPDTGDPNDPGSGGGSGQDDDSDIEIRTNMGYLHVSDDSNSTYARGIAMVGDYASLELTLDYRFEDTDNGTILRLQLRASRDWNDWQTPTRCYEMSLNNTGGWGLHQVEGGSRSSLGSINESPSTLDHKLRFRADGTSIKAKTWLASESEPGWELEVSGSMSDLGGLQLGLFNQGGDHKVYIDNLDLHIP